MELWSASAEPALGTVVVSTGQGLALMQELYTGTCQSYTCTLCTSHHTSRAWGAGPSTFLLNPIITKPVQLQLNKTGIFHCCNIFYFLTGDVGTSNPVCSQAEQDGRTLSSEGN